MKEDWASWLNYQDYKKMGTSFAQMAAPSEGGAVGSRGVGVALGSGEQKCMGGPDGGAAA